MSAVKMYDDTMIKIDNPREKTPRGVTSVPKDFNAHGKGMGPMAVLLSHIM